MRSSVDWFSMRAEKIWKAFPLKSFQILAPYGCNIDGVTADVKNWCAQNSDAFGCDKTVAAFSLTVDTTTSTRHFVHKFQRSLSAKIPAGNSPPNEAYLSDQLEALIDDAQFHSFHPVVIISRFESLAFIADDDLQSVLATMRALEHDGKLTTIASSRMTYTRMREELSSRGEYAFINSAYGDNHETAVLPPISAEEFLDYAKKQGLPDQSSLAALTFCGGPDQIFEAAIASLKTNTQHVLAEMQIKAAPRLQKFLSYVRRTQSGTGDSVWTRLGSNRLTTEDLAYLKHDEYCDYLIQKNSQGAWECSSPVLANLLCTPTKDSFVPPPHVPIVKPSNALSSLRVLIVVCNAQHPDDKLELDEEFRAIQMAVSSSNSKVDLDIKHAFAARPDDLLNAVGQHSPDIVHFSGHGLPDGIVMQGDTGNEVIVGGTALARLFKAYKPKLVILNSCFSKHQATEISKVVHSVIATNKEVGDEAARRFALAFYRKVSEGKSIAEAFEDGGIAVDLYGLEDVYQLSGEDQFLHIALPT